MGQAVRQAAEVGAEGPGGDRGAADQQQPLPVPDGLPRGGGGVGRAADGKGDEHRESRHSLFSNPSNTGLGKLGVVAR